MSKRLKLSDLAKVVAQKGCHLCLERRCYLGRVRDHIRVILPADKEKVDRLTFDQVVTKFLHVLGQGVILGSSLAVRSRDFTERALNQKAVAESAEMEMVRAQNRAIELEGALAEEKAKGKKLAEDADARDKVIARLEARISELERSQSLTQGRIIAAQLAHQYPDLGVDLEDVEMDHELLAKEEAEAEKQAAEEGAAGAELDNLEATYSFPQGYDFGFLGMAKQFYQPAKARCLYSLSPLPDSGWYYFKARPEKNLLRGSPSNVKGWKTSCNKLPTLSEVDAKRTETVFGKIEPGGYFGVSKVLGSRTFRKHFAVGCTALSTSGGDNTTSGDDGEFVTREDSVEYLGVIRRGIGGAIRRALPGIPDETLLRWLGWKVKDPFTNLLSGKSGSSSDSGSDSISNSELPPELRSDAKPPTKGVVIWEKRSWEGDHVIEIGKPDSSKGKEAAPPPPPKRFKSNRGAINARGRAAEAGTSSPGGIGSESMMSDASVARRLLTGVIPASDKKEVDGLSENELVAKSFHALGQVVVFASSLALRSQEHLHDIDFHMARADSAELELVKAQKRAVKAENRLVELSEEGSKPSTEVDDLKAIVAELTNKLAKAKELAIEDFKASGEFKLLHQFPNLGVDVANMAMDPNFAEEEEAMKEGEDPVAGIAPDV
ncbi:hypothetical protein Acr_27g0001620 [Actinidia rufa]|uniref:Uncharacterized protein n=1 Tax=Actinidia rufa TaxID=165716 RepID=A0A7J0H5P7_9ERIC|nr:hypothetical protein Acr_27g0001620 [Actinidia rufa]